MNHIEFVNSLIFYIVHFKTFELKLFQSLNANKKGMQQAPPSQKTHII